MGKVSVTPLANTHRPLFYGDSNVIFERYGSSGKNNELWYFRLKVGDMIGSEPAWANGTARHVTYYRMGFGKNQDIDASYEIWNFSTIGLLKIPEQNL